MCVCVCVCVCAKILFVRKVYSYLRFYQHGYL